MLYEVVVYDVYSNEIKSDMVEASSCEEALEIAATVAKEEAQQ